MEKSPFPPVSVFKDLNLRLKDLVPSDVVFVQSGVGHQRVSPPLSRL